MSALSVRLTAPFVHVCNTAVQRLARRKLKAGFDDTVMCEFTVTQRKPLVLQYMCRYMCHVVQQPCLCASSNTVVYVRLGASKCYAIARLFSFDQFA